MRFWTRFHHCNGYLRFSVKVGLFALAVLFVAYPYPTLLVRHLQHWANLEGIIDPDHAALDDLARRIEPHWSRAPDPSEQLRLVEAFVVDHIAYAYDWETWGVADYLPTLEETMASGREDCDGRAVVAASLLRRFGVEANLVADGAHVWVWTPQGEAMGPTSAGTFRATEDGMELNWSGLLVMPRAWAYGLAVFPWLREAILAVVAWLLMLRPGLGRVRAVVSAASLAAFVVLVRIGGSDWHAPQWWVLVGAAAALAIGFVATFVPWRRLAPIAASQ